MGEFELIRRYFAAAPCAQAAEGVALGIGDDCALLQPGAGRQLAVSTDTLVAGVHFPDPCDAFLLGQRALAVNVSDLAAMGAEPLAFTLALTLPDARADWLDGLARGLSQMAGHCAIALVGGDTTRGPLSLTLTVFGQVPAGQALTRAGARPGDLLCVGGSLGDGAGALPLVLGRQAAVGADADYLLQRYWAPEPQLALGQWLRGRATAALDISDGLLADCGHIAAASGLSLEIELERLPLSPALRALAGTAATDCALGGGDDYRLAFTLPPELLPGLQAQWPEAAVIGRARPGQGVSLVNGQGRHHEPSRTGYQHFGSRGD
ncbi:MULTISPECIES: thiamine-phosphate kinase [unclassified Pseudomonas]|uniref:thiamine-phosphate kinase n=1 Tax=unclassified Pseudomonas TaxID=196821 RepID=UPI002447565C|nr:MULTISPECIES: thiamine-phosphate kinase [unclassified Pseudomonas]MDH0897626.1 thiamine-phosphate kinase [Pseudomonas sp. GD03875]MDH1067689.1 thiamine-phosphate kinase [Pseudomonas sp. GD03985]